MFLNVIPNNLTSKTGKIFFIKEQDICYSILFQSVFQYWLELYRKKIQAEIIIVV